MDELSLERLYPPRFFARRYKLNWRAPIVVEAIQRIFQPDSVLDVGCATGDLVAEWDRRGVMAFGLEGSTAALDYLETKQVFFYDLKLPVQLDVRFDLATCFEVLEHIEPEGADQLVENLVGFSDRLLLSAAPPGQGGHHHVNCKPLEYWLERFARHDYLSKKRPVEAIKAAWAPWRNKPGITAFYHNLFYVERV
jgi:SAM-dependent methyltransferase